MSVEAIKEIKILIFDKLREIELKQMEIKKLDVEKNQLLQQLEAIEKETLAKEKTNATPR